MFSEIHWFIRSISREPWRMFVFLLAVVTIAGYPIVHFLDGWVAYAVLTCTVGVAGFGVWHYDNSELFRELLLPLLGIFGLVVGLLYGSILGIITLGNKLFEGPVEKWFLQIVVGSLYLLAFAVWLLRRRLRNGHNHVPT